MRRTARVISSALIAVVQACASNGDAAVDPADAADDLRLQAHPLYAEFIGERSADLGALYPSTPNRFYTSAAREKWTYSSFDNAEGSRIATDAQVFAGAGIFAEQTLGQQADADAIRNTRTFSRRNIFSGDEVEAIDQDTARAMAAMTRVSGRAIYTQGLRIGNNLYVAVFARHRHNLFAARREYGLIFQATDGETRILGYGEVGRTASRLIPAYQIIAGRVLPATGNELSGIDTASAPIDDVAEIGANDPGLPDENDA